MMISFYDMSILSLTVDNIVFCRMTNLQLSLYKHLLNSRLVKSCLCSGSYSSSNHQFPPHLVCIGVLKKLCNSPGLIYEGAVESGRGTAADDEYDQDTQEVLANNGSLMGLNLGRGKGEGEGKKGRIKGEEESKGGVGE